MTEIVINALPALLTPEKSAIFIFVYPSFVGYTYSKTVLEPQLAIISVDVPAWPSRSLAADRALRSVSFYFGD
ncbi:MAG: hypothetical protein IKE69_01395 [Thermoguttaceae bacterium]|nr:hypothetical protein [Thermoguttaceae bacterium]